MFIEIIKTRNKDLWTDLSNSTDLFCSESDVVKREPHRLFSFYLVELWPSYVIGLAGVPGELGSAKTRVP